LTNLASDIINILVTLKHVDDGVDGGAVPPTSTISTLDDVCVKTVAGYADSMLRHKKRQNGTIQSQCVFDGGEPGSIHGIGAVELPVGDDRKSSKQNKRKREFCTSGLIATG
jgi:hypothetical protein